MRLFHSKKGSKVTEKSHDFAQLVQSARRNGNQLKKVQKKFAPLKKRYPK